MSETAKGDIEVMGYDFKRFTNVNITGIDISSLNANAYGARGTYRMKGTHYYELREGGWIADLGFQE